MSALKTDATLLSRAALGARGPFKLTTAVTWVCEQRCTHCRIWQRERSDELSAGQWRQVWRSVSDSLSWLDLTGGEVTSRDDFAEIAIAAVEECPGLAMLHYPTNGRRPERLETVTRAIRDAGPARLILSLSMDGPPALHDKLRGDKGSWECTVESFRRIRALGVEVYFGMTVSKWNARMVEPTFQALADVIPGLTWRDLHVNFLHVSDHFFGNRGITESDPGTIQQVLDDLLERRGLPRHPTHLLEHLYLRHVPEYLETGRSPLPCTSTVGNAFINPTGEVFPCHIWERPLGNLLDYELDLRAVLRDSQAEAARKEVKADRCPGCWTPCEAYPTILAQPGRAFIVALKPGRTGRNVRSGSGASNAGAA